MSLLKPEIHASFEPRHARYDAEFFSGRGDRALTSAQAVVPLLLDMLRPSSVLDVGCGSGEWLFAFIHGGVHDVHGVDPHADASSHLMISTDRISRIDAAQPFRLGRRYDLVLCLEVAEHLPASAAETLVESLTSHGDTVVFSAAVPGQGGHGHVNEQWLEYWVQLFEARGFRGHDLLRPLIWERADIAPYYRQNMVVFRNAAAGDLHDGRIPASDSMHSRVRSLVHPDTLRYHVGLRYSPPGIRRTAWAVYSTLALRLGLWKQQEHPCPAYPPETGEK